jgi:diacylglycerol kinase (ATP)
MTGMKENNPANTHKNTGFKRIIKAFGYSMDGFVSTFKSEAAFRQLILINIILIPISFFIAHNAVELILLIASCLISLIVELLNSAIEAAIDRISLEINPLSKKAKDAGSSAQFLALCLIGITWFCLLYSRI